MRFAAKQQKFAYAPAVKQPSVTGGLGLEAMGDLSALLAAPEPVVQGGVPLALDMALIDEDPQQPRTQDNPGFSEQSLDELAASIALRGVKTPISVRENPRAPGRYLINHGARRFRAAQRAGQTTIPGFIDNDYNEADQVVENLQRNELTAREVADFIGRELAKGRKKGDIAKAISKSPAFISQHVTLLDLPEPLAQAFNGGRVRDVTVINELMTAYKKSPEEVAAWIQDPSQEITRGSVKLLRDFLEERSLAPTPPAAPAAAAQTPRVVDGAATGAAAARPAGSEGKALRKQAMVHVRHNGRDACLLLDRSPAAEGDAWLQYLDDGQQVQAHLQQVILVAVRAA